MGVEAAGDRVTPNAVQDEMVRALRSLQEGQNLMASMMTQVQRKQ